eukprot:TRINITY_DN74234_c0_g1_i1.p1 TRINITY_DN74234_c0_g1~~TRINITY_DN74234_c0_g1_i1.p1  ORF type:complete len:941 (+),score=278.77 TRINITY_DN74234_c0_g1_i1:104-2824(+)
MSPCRHVVRKLRMGMRPAMLQRPLAISGQEAQIVRPRFAAEARRFNASKVDEKEMRGMATAATTATTNDESAAKFGGQLGHWEDWMINLRREDDWLVGDRAKDWYTGVPPVHGLCPGVTADGHIKSLPMPNLKNLTRKGIQDYFDNTWTLTESLFAGFKGEEPFYRPPVHGLRHPQIFYYGHAPCLYINKLRVAGVLDEPVNAYFESIFEVGVDEMLWDDMHKNDMLWPTVKEVQEYRKQVYNVISELIQTHPGLEDGRVVTWDDKLWALFMAFEHERIHLETSSVLFRETPLHLMQVPKAWPALHPSARRVSKATKPEEGVDYPKNEMIGVSGGSVELGKPRDFPSYGWDNEYGHRQVEVSPFKASKFMVTNGEFWQFVASGGYTTEKYWAADGWGWRRYRNMRWPFFWEVDGPQGSMRFRLRTIYETIDMQWDWPVDVNYHEARAYCAWKAEQDGLSGADAYRVITEGEHHLIRDNTAQMAPARQDPYKDRALVAGGAEYFCNEAGAANSNLAYASQSPVNALPPSSTGHHDVMGNAWEWCEDHFNPLDGFKTHHVYEDFSTPCYDGKHHMIMGGSFASTGDNGASIFCRYHFRPHFLQHSGFRMVSAPTEAPAKLLEEVPFGDAAPEAGADAAQNAPVYETQELLNMYLGMHFLESGRAEGVPNIIGHADAPAHALAFPQRMARLLAELKPTKTTGRVLDVGCAVGGSSFELATLGFEEVVALDFSESFIDAAKKMQRGDEVKFQLPLEGDISEEITAALDKHIDAAARQKVQFHVGNACKIKADAPTLGKFDGAVLANLLCRLPEPAACLDGLQEVISPGGVVVFATPFSWLEQFTHRSKWIGGFRDPVSGAPIHSAVELQKQMEQRGFEKVHQDQFPLLIREHQRKYQYIVSDVTAWRKKA